MADPTLLSPSAQSAVCTLQTLGRASGMLGNADSYQVARVCEATKEVLVHRAKQLVVASLGSPILSSKSCDGTPVRAVHYTSFKLPGLKRQKTHGKEGREVLVANQFVRYRDAGEGWCTAALLSEPVPLTLGKEVPMVLAAARRTWVSLRSLGAGHCIVEHYCWDRAGIAALEQQCRQWHLSQPIPECVIAEPGIREHLEFVVVTPCALHDSQNAFRWAFAAECKDRSLMRDLYIAVESLRNSSDLLSSRLASWIAQHLVFEDTKGLVWREQQRVLWTGLDVDPEIVAMMVHLELAWCGNRFSVCMGAKAHTCRK